MKTVVLVTTLLLCSTQVLTLKCYSCEGEDQNDCKTAVTCKENETFCKIRGLGDNVTRGCAKECDEDTMTTCCQVDLC
ncbi:lymphocyte antigen 6D [Syngnathoides biaculeatus]|uniref:lymphocyte antigen 6D n=1 Tax=Syngnathoides biaculeatus TaxID=300417 RepID=UPI002ADD84C2|nr:lymphocyte antigen 6D [Syngnathoides biaculeatus]